MILTILGILLLLIGILLLNNDNDLLSLCCILSFVIGASLFLFCVVSISCIQINKDVNYQNTFYEREMLEYRIEHIEENITGNEMLYNDIVEFNNELRTVKKWVNNPWVNWFINDDIATIDYIELDK